MKPTGRQFRVFVSSTFSDFKHERQALQDRVFPELRTYCEKRGAHFQAIDLRWGISEEAAQENKTVRICLEEIRRAQRLSPRLNFIVLLGNRYGWRPMPDEIPAPEFESLIRHLSAAEAKLVRDRYRRDENAVPPVYYLHAPLAENVEAEKGRLVAVLRRAVSKAGLPASDRLKYFASATHLEIHEGLLKISDADQHVFAYNRKIENLSEGEAIAVAEDFIDAINGAPDTEAAIALAELKQRVCERLPGNFRDYPARWLGKDISRDHIESFCADVVADLKSVIDQELERLEAIDPLEWNIAQHQAFGSERARVFIGREKPLQQMADYLASESTTPLVIHGPGGIGKSALLAKAIERIDTGQFIVVQRFIGATPDSGQLRGLLSGLCTELGRFYASDETVQYEKFEELIELFQTRLALATSGRPLVLVIDSLDQLDAADMVHQLQWLPQSLPANVRVILSTRENQTDMASHPVYAFAERRYAEGLLALGPLDPIEGAEALDALLGHDRTLSEAQYRSVLTAFAPSGLPLYLKLAAEQARRWRSETLVPELPTTVPELIRSLIARLQQPVNHGPLFVERALGYLQAGRYGGLAEDELARTLALDLEVVDEFHSRSLQPWDHPELPPILWSRLHADLAPYLTEQTVDGTLLHRFFHQEFAEVVKADGLAGEAGQARHGTLAKAFSWHSDPAAFRRSEGPRALRQMMELPYQLRHAGRTRDLQALLTDFNFAYAKCAANRSDDLLSDFPGASVSQRPAPESDLGIWIQFMRSRAYILRRGTRDWPAHKILQQLAVEHADESPVTKSAESWLETGECDWLWFRCSRRPKLVERDPCLAVMEDHTGEIDGAEELTDGRILSWSGDRMLRLWSSEGVPLAVFRGHTDRIWGALTLGGDRLLSWSEDHTLRLWSREGEPLVVLRGHENGVRGALVLADGHILSWGGDHALRLWSAEGVPLGILEGHTDGVIGALVLFDGKLLSWSEDHTMRTWSAKGKPLSILEGHTKGVNGVTVLADGRVLSWSEDRTLRLWSAEGAPLATLVGHTDAVRGALTLRDGRLLSWSGELLLFDYKDPAVLEYAASYNPKFRKKVEDILRAEVSGRPIDNPVYDDTDWDSVLRLWSAEGDLLKTLVGHTRGIKGALELRDGRLLTWSYDGTLRLWSESGEQLAQLEGHTSWVEGALALGGGRLVSWGGVRDPTLRLWSDTGELLLTLKRHTGWIRGVLALSNDRLLSWGAIGDNVLRLWSTADATHTLNTFEGHTDPIGGVLVLADERLLSWTHERLTQDYSLRLWSEKGEPLAKLEGHTNFIRGALELSDSRLLSWSKDHSLRLWSAAGEPLTIIEAHTGGVKGALELSDDRLLSWSDDSVDCTLRLWSTAGKPLTIFEGHTGGVKGALELSDDRLLSWSEDHTMRTWSAKGKPLSILEGHTKGVNGATVLADGRVLSWSSDNTLRLWSEKGEPLAKLESHAEYIRGALELSDGRLLSWDNAHVVKLWSAEGELLANLSESELREPKYAELFLAYRRALRPDSVSGGSAAVGAGLSESAVVSLLFLSDSHCHELKWHSSASPNIVFLIHNDKVVAGLENGQVLLLQICDCKHPVGLTEARASLGFPTWKEGEDSTTNSGQKLNLKRKALRLLAKRWSF